MNTESNFQEIRTSTTCFLKKKKENTELIVFLCHVEITSIILRNLMSGQKNVSVALYNSVV